MTTQRRNRKLLFGAFLKTVGTKYMTFRLVAVAAGLATSFFVTTSLAVYSDSDAPANSRFQSGTLALTLDNTSALFNVNNLKPGDVVYAPLTLTNSGTIDLAYTMSSVATNADGKNLAAALVAEVKRPSGSTCDASAFASAASLATQVTGIGSLAVSTPQTISTGGSVFTCFKVSLPVNASNLLQGSATNVTFTFDSTQT